MQVGSRRTPTGIPLSHWDSAIPLGYTHPVKWDPAGIPAGNLGSSGIPMGHWDLRARDLRQWDPSGNPGGWDFINFDIHKKVFAGPFT